MSVCLSVCLSVCVCALLYFFGLKVNVFITCLYIPVFVLSLDIQLLRENLVMALSCLTLPHISVYAKPPPEFTTKFVVISVGGAEWFEVGCSC